MVSYQQWFEAVHEAASRKGLRGENTGRQRQSLTQDLARVWQENKAELQSMSVTEARSLADEIVTV